MKGTIISLLLNMLNLYNSSTWSTVKTAHFKEIMLNSILPVFCCIRHTARHIHVFMISLFFVAPFFQDKNQSVFWKHNLTSPQLLFLKITNKHCKNPLKIPIPLKDFQDCRGLSCGLFCFDLLIQLLFLLTLLQTFPNFNQ